MLKELIIAFQAYFRAHRFINRHRLWKWILIPGIIYAILFFTGMWLFWGSTGQFLDWLFQNLGVLSWLKRMQNDVLNFLFITGTLIFRLILLFFYFSLFKYLFLILGSPLFAWLSEQTENIIEGKETRFDLVQLLKDMWRGIRVALRNTMWQSVYTITILLFSLVPLVGWVTPMVAFMVECYYYGFSMLDYSAERHKLTPAESAVYIGSRKGLAIGNGMVFYLMHLIPIIGWVLAPAYAVIAATLSLYHQNDEP